MDFVSKAFGSLNLGLPFKLEDEIPTTNLPYKLYDATLKKDGSECSVFVYEEQAQNIAENANSALRKLKLPGVVKHIETLPRSGQTFIVTERVTQWDMDQLSYESRKFIMQFILETLNTLEAVAKCTYNGLSTQTVMMAKQSGLPTLVGFDFASSSPNTSPPSYVQYYQQSVPTPPDSANSPTLNTYQFGCLVEAFLPEEKRFITSLKSQRRVPIQRLVTSSSAEQVLGNRIKEIVLGDVQRVLLLPPHELARLCEKLVELADVLYEGLISAAVLPDLLKSKDPCTFLAIITLISKLHSSIGDETPIAQFIGSQFTMLDRVVRLKLLQLMPDYLPLLSNRFVQQRIMPKMGFGFSDTEAVIRKASVAATIYLADKITRTQLNSDLLRLISRTHADSDPDIRALSTTTLCRIAPKLDNTKIVTTALSKALRDPVAKCRSAALLGVTELEIPAQEIADKLLASAAHGMLDKDPSIAADSWRVTDYLLGEIRKASSASGPSSKALVTDEASRSATASPAPSSSRNESVSANGPANSSSSGTQSVPAFGGTAISAFNANTPRNETSSSSMRVPTPSVTLHNTTFTPHGGTAEEVQASQNMSAPEEPSEVSEDAWGWGDEDDQHVSEVDEEAWGW